MGIVCVDVHEKVQAFKRERLQGGGEGRTLSTKVFWQSKWKVLSDVKYQCTILQMITIVSDYSRLLVSDVSGR
jgi:hypothetical protein